MRRNSLLSIAMQLLGYRNATSPGGGIGRRARFRSQDRFSESPVAGGFPATAPASVADMQQVGASPPIVPCSPSREGGGMGGGVYSQNPGTYPPIHSTPEGSTPSQKCTTTPPPWSRPASDGWVGEKNKLDVVEVAFSCLLITLLLILAFLVPEAA